MVQKEETKRGRPREYDPDEALQSAMDAFWDGGFSGTPLDLISDRTGMNRPSLYAAFGDKEALYLKTLESYVAGRRAMVADALGSDRPIGETLRDSYRAMIDWFLRGDGGARGCYLIATAATESLANPRVRQIVAESQADLDRLFTEAFSAAQARGELARHLDPKALAIIATAMAHSLALRARAGQPRAQLREIADSVVDLISSGGGPPRVSRNRLKRRVR